jgi:Mrp family chromosome partitioning ATPase
MKPASAAVLSLAQLLAQQPTAPPPCLVEPGLLPPQGILFVGGEPKVGKSLLVANLALSLAAGADRLGSSALSRSDPPLLSKNDPGSL